MDCKEAEKMIPAFLAKELDNNSLKQFLKHVESCSECKEELTIQYLVMTGATLLERGQSFDLRKAMDELIAEGEAQVHRNFLLTVLSYVLEAAAIAAVIIILIMVIF
jgi:hypothetical protein